MTGDSETADVFDFVDAYLADLERGEDRPLAHWLARFPRSQEAIAREWLALRQPSSAARHETKSATAAASGDDGRERLGPYRILRELGRGGQGTVFLAEDTRIARRVALKVLASRFDSVSDEKRNRFKREADVIAKLEHPGLCSIHDAELDGEAPWIAMRYVEGRTLGEALVEARERAGSEVLGLHLPPRTAVEMHAVLSFFERAARALHAAHEAGVVHRDVKPGNMIVALDGRPVLLDFGLARDETSETGTLTQSGDVFGTPAYMSPEQLTLSSSQLDRRTDVYSLGIALYEALTLERPFEHAAKSALYRAIQSDPPPDPRKKNKVLSEDVKVVLETALEKDRDRRYPTTLEFAEDLRRIREYEPIHARPASMGLKLARWARRHPALAVAITGTILSLSIGLAVSLRLLDREREALRVALGRHLAQRTLALAAEDPPASVVLGIQGVERVEGVGREANERARSGLLVALEACWLVTTIGPVEKTRETLLVDDIATSPSSKRFAAAFSDGTVWLAGLDVDGDRRTFPVPDHDVVDLQFHPRDERLLWAGASGALELRDSATGARLAEARLEGPLTCAVFSPDGALVLALGQNAGAVLLDARDLGPVRALAPLANGFALGRFSPDGRVVALFGDGVTPVVCDVQTGARAFEIVTGGGARDVQFTASAAHHRLLVAGVDGAVHVLDAQSGRETGPTLRTSIPSSAIVPGPDGTHAVVLANRGEEGEAFLWDLDTGASTRLSEPGGPIVTQAAFGPDRRRLATTSKDQHVRIWDVASGALRHEFRSTRWAVDVAWSADGERLVTRPVGATTADVWFARVRPDVFELEGHSATIHSVAFTRDGRTALTASDDGSARLWNVDPRSATGFASERARFEHTGPVRWARFGGDDRVVLTVGAGSEARTWDALSGRPLRDLARHPTRIVDAALDPAGSRFATTCADGRARLWETRGDAPPLVLAGEQSHSSSIEFSLDGALVAVAEARGAIRLFDPRDGHLVRAIEPKDDTSNPVRVVDLAFRPGADVIAVACDDKRLRWFRTSDGTSPTERAMVFSFKSLSFSGDGGRLLLVGAHGGGAVRSLALGTGRNAFPDSSHTDDITSASYSEDGTIVLTTSKDHSARAWRSDDFAPLVRRDDFTAAVTCGAVSNALGEARAITGCADGRVSVWPIDPLPSARSRKLPPLSASTIRREARLAAPLEYP